MEEEEDSHLCLKCNLTLVGLDNYVLHRRSKCGAGSEFPSIFEPSPRITEDRPRTDDPYSPSKALDFFSSLNLRSNRLEDFLDFDLPIQKTSMDMPTTSTSKHNDMRFPDIELDANFEPIVDLMKNRKNNFDGLDLEHENLINDTNIAHDHKFGRSILDSDIFAMTNDNLYVLDQHLNLPMDQALRLSQRPPSQPVSEKPMPYRAQESHYFCRPCNRRLSSRVSHEKHLKSELHFKRLAENSAYNMETVVSPTPPQQRRNRRRRQLPHRLLDYNTSVRKYSPRVTKICTPQSKYKKTPRRFIYCGVCSLRVMERLMGKHLVSHFHCIQAQNYPEVARSLILDNIHRIVRHSPFQCALCKFYYNTPDNLLLHFTSQSHHDMDSKNSGVYWCQQCKVETSTSDEMVEHLKSPEHNQLALNLNHMVPIIVRKRSQMMCRHCGALFSLNIKLFMHVREVHDFEPDLEPVFNCYHCEYIGTTQRNLQRHEIGKHGAKNVTGYFCTPCDLVFSSREVSIKHRQQLDCRIKCDQARGVDVSRRCNICSEQCPDLNALKAHLFANHFGALSRCKYCFETFAISQDLARHVRDGKCSLMASEQTATTRKSEAKFSFARFSCDICDKTYARRRTLTNHIKKIHLKPKVEKPKTDQVPNYQCGYCGKTLSKKYLLVRHINTIHVTKAPTVILPTVPSSSKGKKSPPKKPAVQTKAKKNTKKKTPQFMCAFCDRQFIRRYNLITHFKRKHRKNVNKKDVSLNCEHCAYTTKEKNNMTRHMITMHLPGFRSRDWKCNICPSSFYDKYGLHQHVKLHYPKEFHCDERHCTYSARYVGELNRHRKVVHSAENQTLPCSKCHFVSANKFELRQHVLTHTEQRPYGCKKCSKRFSIKSHLLRHMRNHEDNRPFKCRYCKFSCKTLENLRKHILKTNKHPGKLMYHCKLCKTKKVFATNDGNTFRMHLHGYHQEKLQAMNIGTKNILPYALGICENFLEVSRKEKSQLSSDIYPPRKIASKSKVDTTSQSAQQSKKMKPMRKPAKKELAMVQENFAVEHKEQNWFFFVVSRVERYNDKKTFDKMRRNFDGVYTFLRPKLNIPLEEINHGFELEDEVPTVSIDMVTEECLASPGAEVRSQPGPPKVPLVETSRQTQRLMTQDAATSSRLLAHDVTIEPQPVVPVLVNPFLCDPTDPIFLRQYMSCAHSQMPEDNVHGRCVN